MKEIKKIVMKKIIKISQSNNKIWIKLKAIIVGYDPFLLKYRYLINKKLTLQISYIHLVLSINYQYF